MVEIKVYSLDPKSGWHFGQVIGKTGDLLTIRDLDHLASEEQLVFKS